jgi:hypothetical protein
MELRFCKSMWLHHSSIEVLQTSDKQILVFFLLWYCVREKEIKCAGKLSRLNKS